MGLSKEEASTVSAPTSITPFFRLLAAGDKATALADAVAATRQGQTLDGVTFPTDPPSLRQIPGSPFAYWVSDTLRRKFQELPPFEGEGRTVRVGLQTSDDFRFVRVWWEVPPERILDGLNGPDQGNVAGFQEWCRKRMYEGKRWAPFAKGGEYSPYYADVHLVVNWADGGREIYEYNDIPFGSAGAPVRNPDYYFRPGLTWPRRTTSGMSVRALPAGCIFADKGPAAFAQHSCLLPLLALMNSSVFAELVSLQTGTADVAARSYEVGIVQRIPVPTIDVAGHGSDAPSPGLTRGLGLRGEQGFNAHQVSDITNEISHCFYLPAIVRDRGIGTLRDCAKFYLSWQGEHHEAIAACQSDVDEAAARLYGLPSIGEQHERALDPPSIPPERASEVRSLVVDLASFLVGCVTGRWDASSAQLMATKPPVPDPFAPLPVCSPAMLVGDDGLPLLEPPDDYPIRIARDGILVDDADHADDLIHRVRDVLEVLWQGDNGAQAAAIEQEAGDILGAGDLREYYRKPGLFFADHLKRYSKSRRQAPIYWPLSTASGSYTLWLYYHRLTADTLYIAVNRYVEPKIAAVERDLAGLAGRLAAASGREATRLRERLEETRKFLGELGDFREELLRVAGLPYQPNLDDGVIINAAPLHRLFRLPKWAKDTRECWEKLQRGDYDWAHLAYLIWPERVRAKCRTDRSLAIAHDREDLYVAPPAAKVVKRKRANGSPGAGVGEDATGKADEMADEDAPEDE